MGRGLAMRAISLLVAAGALCLAALASGPAPAAAGWGGTHAATLAYPEYVYHPPRRAHGWRCRYRDRARCREAAPYRPWLQRYPRAYYRFHGLGWNW